MPLSVFSRNRLTSIYGYDHPAGQVQHLRNQTAKLLSLPALILCREDHGSHPVATLPLLDRLVVAAFRAGCTPIHIVSASTPPNLPRSHAWKIPVQLHLETPELAGSALIIQSTWLLQAADLQRAIARQGRLVTADGRPIPAGFISLGSSIPPQSRLDDPQTLEKALSQGPSVLAEGLTKEVLDAPSAKKASQALWDSITSSSDGFVDRWFNRPVGRAIFSKAFVRTPITPNQISGLSIGVGVIGAWLIASGERASTVWGALLFQLSAVIDCVDGDVARVLFKESKLGKWLDLGGDQVVHISIFGAIAWGLHRAGSNAPVLMLGAVCIVGAILSFAVVLHGILRPPPGPAHSRLQAFIDGATSRDFSVLVLALAAIGKLEWFLWLTAIGSQVFWITALLLQRDRSSGK
jgi:phosphatidylglycerophosphate synthase